LTLDGYVAAFHHAAVKMRADGASPAAFRQLSVHLVRNAATRDRARTTCWAEVLLDARRHPESLALARDWFENLGLAWLDIASAARVENRSATSRSAIDLGIGLLFITIALGLNEGQVAKVLDGDGDLIDLWQVPPAFAEPLSATSRKSRKSDETREKVISAAVDLLISDGPGAVSFRAIASKAGISPAGPFYHFPTIAGVLAAAQERLFVDSKERYRAVVSADQGGTSLDRLVDRTTAVLIREATQFSGSNLAAYAIWINADRESELRPMIWSAIKDQQLAWQRTLARIMPTQRPLDALIAQSLFVGKLVRLLSTGSVLEDLSQIRTELTHDFSALVEGKFWF